MRHSVVKPVSGRCAPARWVLLAASMLVAVPLHTGHAFDNEWNPFREKDERAARRTARQPVERPSSEPAAVPGFDPNQPYTRPPATDSGASKVERVELAPLPSVNEPAPAPGVNAPAVSAPSVPGPAIAGLLPVPARATQPVRATGPMLDLWRGVDMRQLENLIAPLDVPPKSMALHGLWTRLLMADATAPTGGKGPNHFEALRLEALYRSGLVPAMGERLANTGTSGDDWLITAFKMRHALASGNAEAACENAKRLEAKRDGLPKLLKGEVHVVSGYCAAVAGHPQGAGLAAELAREDEVEAPFALQVMDALGAGEKSTKLTYPKRLMVLEYRLLEQLGTKDVQAILASAEPALLVAIATGEASDARLTLASAEAAAGLHALPPERLAEVYASISLPANAGADPFFRRAALFKTLTAETQAARRLQIARQLIDDARRSGLGLTMTRALARPLGDVRSGAETGPLAVVAVETALASGDFARARQFASGHVEAQAWLALVDIADPPVQGVSDGALAAIDGLARQGRFDAASLHRLATVLDALDVNVPIPLWEAASRTPQQTTGHLPETGTLPQLQEAARKGEIGRTALLVMRTIGPQGPASAHLIALGDSIRALRRVGLEADARALAVESLYAAWPRG